MTERQQELFAREASGLPDGFQYFPDLLTEPEEEALIFRLEKLPFAPFEFHGFLGKRRVISYGWRYDFAGGGLQKTEDLPVFLQHVRDKAALVSGVPASALQHALITEYSPGAAIGWHKDRSVFGEVIGVSLLGACTFRFRRASGETWERRSLLLAPRSAYLLHGPSRLEWEHSIPAVETLRYSITFRTLKSAPPSSSSPHGSNVTGTSAET